jgi:putative peptidoglycan binding protein
MADDQNKKALVARFPGSLVVGAAREAEERRRVEGIARDIEELGRALEVRDRLVSLSAAERVKSSRVQEHARTQAAREDEQKALAQERARIQAAREDEQKLLAQERARTQALEQQLAAREDAQKLLVQERARTQALEQQLAARRDGSPERGRTTMASLSDRPASTPLAPAPDKLVTTPLHASGKQVMLANQKSRALMRPINVALAVLLVVGAYLVGRLSPPDNDPRSIRTLDQSMRKTIVAPAPPSSEAPREEVSAPPPQVTSGSAPRDAAATAPAGISAATTLTPEVIEPKVIEPKVVVDKSSAKGPPLSSGELRELQAWLKVLGFDPGPADGLVGDRTNAAIRHYQGARHLEETGVPDQTLLRQVRKDIGH